jgi:hypothetical protein
MFNQKLTTFVAVEKVLFTSSSVIIQSIDRQNTNNKVQLWLVAKMNQLS